MSLSDRLNFDLAWNKAKSNLRDSSRIFLNNPYIVEILDRNESEYIEYLENKVDNEYNPSESRIVNIPKSGWNVRPGSILQIDDVTIYSALILAIYEDIRDAIEWSAMDRRYSRVMIDDIEKRGWIKYPGKTWDHWNKKSRELIEEYNYVLFTDISSYFENIEHRVLDSNLRDITDKELIINEIRSCLRRWSHPRERGIPQGYYPSDILSEVYLNRVDERLKLNDIQHTRFSDNVRIFCNSKKEAIEYLELLTEIYRDRGLNLQREKTQIVDSESALQQLADPVNTIDKLEPRVGGRIEREAKGGGPYDGGTGGEFTGSPATDGGEREDIDAEEVDVDSALLEAAFEEHIVGSDSFNQHLFRYLITRLGILDNEYAVSYCVDRILEGKTETRHILDRYFSRLSNKELISERLSNCIDNDEIMYEFQKFAIIRWLFETGVETDNTKSAVRNLIRTSHEQPETENYAIAYLGEYGNSADLDSIQELYDGSRNNIQKATILMAIREMETGLRNSVYSRAEDDHTYCEFATRLAKEKASD